MATEEIYSFLKEHNRPFSANDIQSGHGKEYGKTAIQKALDKLVRDNKIMEKSYGKQKVYCFKQDADGDIDQQLLQEELKKIDREIHEVSINLKQVEEKLFFSTDALKTLQSKKTFDELKTEKKELLEDIIDLKKKLVVSEKKAVPVSDEDKRKQYRDYENLVKEFKKRKRICTDMVNAIMEGYPKTKKHLFEEVGMETDEDAGFILQENI